MLDNYSTWIFVGLFPSTSDRKFESASRALNWCKHERQGSNIEEMAKETASAISGRQAEKLYGTQGIKVLIGRSGSN
jgi:hypothetical protein